MVRKIKSETVPYDMETFPKRIKQDYDDETTFSCSALPDTNSLLLSIQPPNKPRPFRRAPCDIVLVIDVSGSMFTEAPLPGSADVSESAGLSILDLVKHSALTIIETLNKGDRLALVTFSDNVEVIHRLIPMTPSNKKQLRHSIQHLQGDGATNLWGGIKAGLELFEQAPSVGNVQGLYILTDGQPNWMCPPQGYSAKLKPLLARVAELAHQVPTIHTFGFGYDIRSGLLQTIAEIGLGGYAFIPDAGMIGTVFVHAVANLYATYATHAVLTIESTVARQLKCPTVFNSSLEGNLLMLRLGNLQYGQSRDLVLKFPDCEAAHIEARLAYTDTRGVHREFHMSSLNAPPRLDCQYHALRSELCEWLSSFFPTLANGEHRARDIGGRFSTAKNKIELLASHMEMSIGQTGVDSLLLDLVGHANDGQIMQALQPTPWKRWGQHYLPSLLHAYARQVCNSFKDPGPMEFGKDSPLFVAYRDELDAAFERLPPPAPSRAKVTTGKLVTNFSMARFHDQDYGCFEGDCLVRLGDDSTLPVGELRPGMQVWTPVEPRIVKAVVKSVVPQDDLGAGQLVRVGDLWLTPWHPLRHNDKWLFPNDIAEERKLCQSDVYSVLLEKNDNVDTHAVEVGGQICVTLGHGLKVGSSGDDARTHAFFGDYRAVHGSLQRLPVSRDGQHLTQGLRRSTLTGLVCGWQPYRLRPHEHGAHACAINHMKTSGTVSDRHNFKHYRSCSNIVDPSDLPMSPIEQCLLFAHVQNSRVVLDQS